MTKVGQIFILLLALLIFAYELLFILLLFLGTDSIIRDVDQAIGEEDRRIVIYTEKMFFRGLKFKIFEKNF